VNYMISLAVGLLVGVIYGLLNVRSPAPPAVALIGGEAAAADGTRGDGCRANRHSGTIRGGSSQGRTGSAATRPLNPPAAACFCHAARPK
jgi:hypothetical protein